MEKGRGCGALSRATKDLKGPALSIGAKEILFGKADVCTNFIWGTGVPGTQTIIGKRLRFVIPSYS